MDVTQAGTLGAVFAAYVVLIPVFGWAYFLLYRRQSTNFVFAAEINSTRLEEEKRSAEDRISWLVLLLDYLGQAAAEHRENVAQLHPSEGRLKIALGDGRAIVLERHIEHMPPHGAESERAPFVRLLRPNGAEDRAGYIVGHGFLSEFHDWTAYVSAALAPLRDDLRRVKERRFSLDAPQPRIWRFADFLYFSTITQSTVGYGDILPNCTAVRVFVMLQIVLAYALLIVVLNAVVSAMAA